MFEAEHHATQKAGVQVSESHKAVLKAGAPMSTPLTEEELTVFATSPFVLSKAETSRLVAEVRRLNARLDDIGEHFNRDVADVARSLCSDGSWRHIGTAPRNKTYILLAGPSGYTGTPLRVEVCKYDADLRPRQPWVTYSGDSFLDSGGPPTHWMPLPKP